MLPCRGLYLCGGLPREDRAGELLRDPGAVGGAVFVRDVFDRKVFPEHDLARPTNLALIQGGRRLRFLQAAVVILALISTLGLGWARYRLGERKDDLRVFLLGTAQDLEETRDRRLKGAAEHEFQRDKAFHLFDGMAKLDGGWFGSVFIPSSWFSPFNRGLKRAIVRAYNEIILTTLYQELGRSLDRILRHREAGQPGGRGRRPGPSAGGGGVCRPTASSPGTPGTAGASASPLDLRPLDRTPEFTRLNVYVASLRDLETHVVLYNRLRNTESLEDLNAVVHYLFEHDLPKGFFQNSELYARALADVAYTRFQPLQHRPRTTGQAGELGKLLFDRLFAQNPAVADLRSAATLVGEVSSADWNPAAGNTVASLITLSTRLKQAEQELASPDLAWMAGDTLEAGAPGTAPAGGSLHHLPGSPRPPTPSRRRGRSAIRTSAAGFSASRPALSTGPLVARDPEERHVLPLAAGEAAGDALDGLSRRQGFASAAAAAGAPAAVALSPRGRVLWDTVTLQQAEGLYKPYEGFIEKTLAPFPPDLRNTLQISARDRLGARMMTGAGRRRPAGGARARPRLGAAARAGARSRGGELPGRGRPARRPDRPLRQARAVRRQGSGRRGVHRPGGADPRRRRPPAGAARPRNTPKGSGFDGRGAAGHLSLDAYGVRDEAEAAAYLAAQRSTVADISSRYAEPGDPGARRQGLLALPARLVRPLDRDRRAAPALRRQGARQLGRQPRGVRAQGSDRDRARQLHAPDQHPHARRAGGGLLPGAARAAHGARDCCLYLAGGQAAQGYRKLADFFNQRLAGKFPFAASPPGGSTPRPIRRTSGASSSSTPPTRRSCAPCRSPTGRRGPGSSSPAWTASAPSSPPSSTIRRAPGTGVRPRHPLPRQPARGEGGDQILRWSLAAGEQVATHPNARPVIPWTYGTPLRLDSQWAKDSPVIPVESADLPGVHVQGRTAILEVRDRWSLLALVRGLGSPVDADADPGTERLRLQVATRPEADPKATPEMARGVRRPRPARPQCWDSTAGKDAAAATAATAANPAAPAGDLELPAFPLGSRLESEERRRERGTMKLTSKPC